MAIKAKRGDLLDVTKKAPLEAPVPVSKEFAEVADDFDKDSYEFPKEPTTK